MFDDKQKALYYQALITRNPEYEGLFYLGVTSTRVFCHATCPARKPKVKPCEFFKSAKEALLAAYRPCQRCQPLLPPQQAGLIIRKLLALVEQNPNKRWTDQNFRDLGRDSSTAQPLFQKRFGKAFVEYPRVRRIGLVLQQIKDGTSVIASQLAAGYESNSSSREAFTRILDPASSRSAPCVLLASWLDTPLGPMLAIADEQGLYLLEFVERRGLERELERLKIRLQAAIVPGENSIINSIKTELAAYFAGTCFTLQTPIHLLGSAFQKQVWRELMNIPVGTTKSYLEVAHALGYPQACRAVARANGSNRLALIVPCHRVINASGALGGYGGGINRKAWLLQHEQKIPGVYSTGAPLPP